MSSGGKQPGNGKEFLNDREMKLLFEIYKFSNKKNRPPSFRDIQGCLGKNMAHSSILPYLKPLRREGYVTPEGKLVLTEKGHKFCRKIVKSLTCCPLCSQKIPRRRNK